MNESGTKLSFHQHCELVKTNKQYIYNKNIPHATFLRKICENAVFFMQCLNKILPKELKTYHQILMTLLKKSLVTDDIKFDEWRQVDHRV